MGIYRVFLREASGIVGRHDFVAWDDHEAVAMADILCDACSDRCSSFEVWAGGHCIITPRAPRSLAGIEGIQERRQEAVIEHEDAIQRSQWAIASSKRLLERLTELRDLRRDREVYRPDCDRSNYDPGR
jgi:hypothetical protein